MVDTAPTQSDPQRLRALEHANTIRLARAELKRQIAMGETSAAGVILDCPEAATRWTVGDLLMAQPRWGVMRCRKFLERNGIGELKPIGSLTQRQRELLAVELQRRGGRRAYDTRTAATASRQDAAVSIGTEAPSRRSFALA